MSKRHSTPASFGYALSGLKEALVNEPNIRVHFLIGILAIILGFWLNISSNEWVVVFFTIAFVLVLELINTTLEAIVDIVSPRRHPKAKVAKDVSAAAVFVAAVLAIVVGIIIFLPKLIARF
jgi:diacylglycerol kinase